MPGTATALPRFGRAGGPPRNRPQGLPWGPIPVAPNPESRHLTIHAAPIWLQRALSVCAGPVLRLSGCSGHGPGPWWTRMWDQNLFLESRPRLAGVLHLGAVRGLISGLGTARHLDRHLRGRPLPRDPQLTPPYAQG